MVVTDELKIRFFDWLMPNGAKESHPIARSFWDQFMISFTRRERSKITPSRRFEVLKRDGHKCKLCGATSEDSKLEIDHIKPIALGGSSHIHNLQTLCFECNRGKRVSFDEPAVSLIFPALTVSPREIPAIELVNGRLRFPHMTNDLVIEMVDVKPSPKGGVESAAFHLCFRGGDKLTLLVECRWDMSIKLVPGETRDADLFHRLFDHRYLL